LFIGFGSIEIEGLALLCGSLVSYGLDILEAPADMACSEHWTLPCCNPTPTPVLLLNWKQF